MYGYYLLSFDGVIMADSTRPMMGSGGAIQRDAQGDEINHISFIIPMVRDAHEAKLVALIHGLDLTIKK